MAHRLGEHDWLRFACAGNLLGRPNGSAVVFATRTEIVIAQLDEDLVGRPVTRLRVADLAVRRTDRRRLWKRVADPQLRADTRSVTIEGMFADEADELLELISPQAVARCGTGMPVSHGSTRPNCTSSP